MNYSSKLLIQFRSIAIPGLMTLVLAGSATKPLFCMDGGGFQPQTQKIEQGKNQDSEPRANPLNPQEATPQPPVQPINERAFRPAQQDAPAKRRLTNTFRERTQNAQKTLRKVPFEKSAKEPALQSEKSVPQPKKPAERLISVSIVNDECEKLYDRFIILIQKICSYKSLFDAQDNDHTSYFNQITSSVENLLTKIEIIMNSPYLVTLGKISALDGKLYKIEASVDRHIKSIHQQLALTNTPLNKITQNTTESLVTHEFLDLMTRNKYGGYDDRLDAILKDKITQLDSHSYKALEHYSGIENWEETWAVWCSQNIDYLAQHPYNQEINELSILLINDPIINNGIAQKIIQKFSNELSFLKKDIKPCIAILTIKQAMLLCLIVKKRLSSLLEILEDKELNSIFESLPISLQRRIEECQTIVRIIAKDDRLARVIRLSKEGADKSVIIARKLKEIDPDNITKTIIPIEDIAHEMLVLIAQCLNRMNETINLNQILNNDEFEALKKAAKALTIHQLMFNLEHWNTNRSSEESSSENSLGEDEILNNRLENLSL